jgi:excisionase family DNA binding protein
MENPFTLLEERLASIEDLLITMFAKLDEIEKPDKEIIGNVEDCSRWIKKSPSTIYKLISQKKIPHIKSGKKVLFKKEDIMHWLNTGTRSTLTEMQIEIDKKLQNMGKGRLQA